MNSKPLFFNRFSFLLIFAFIFSACNKPNGEPELLDDSFTINNNIEELNTRVKVVREPLSDIDNLKNSDSDGDCNDFTWYLVAEVDAPIFEGEPLSATDVRLMGDKAYVSYNKKGGVPAGGVDIIDISDPTAPEITSFLQFTNADINSLAVDTEDSELSRKIYLAGSNKNGALLRQVIANDGVFTEGYTDVKLSKVYTDGKTTPSANGIGLTNDYIFISTGRSVGGTFQLDRQSLEILAHEEYTSAKAIAVNGLNTGDYQLTLIGGDDAKLLVYPIGGDRSLVRTISLDPIVHQFVDDPYAGKASIAIQTGDNIAYIAMNQNGVKSINIETGEVLSYSPEDMLPSGNTSGVAVDGKTIYLANGLDGMFIGCQPNSSGEIAKVQQWGLNESGASANMIQTDGNWVFLAKGGGGLKILRKVANGSYPAVNPWDDDGKPLLASNESLCDNLLANFELTFPEGVDAEENNKKYLENENREIVLTEEAEVSVCFVAETADYQNAFGYYSYDKNNPPKKMKDIKDSMKVIFANASANGSGGSLNEGDCVNIGSFPAGTVIGYFVIVNGWERNKKKVTEGLDTFFSNPKLNKGDKQQFILMYNDDCTSLLTSFEEIQTKKGDRDFNDLVVKTNVTPLSAVNTTLLNKIPEAK